MVPRHASVQRSYASLRDRLERVLDEQHNRKHRAYLLEQIKESYWKDFQELNRRGTKFYQAPSRLLKADVSLFQMYILGYDWDR